MMSEESFETVKVAIINNMSGRVLSEKFESDIFGNFIVVYGIGRYFGSIVNDRGQIYLCDDIEGASNCEMIVPILGDIGKQELIDLLVTKLSRKIGK